MNKSSVKLQGYNSKDVEFDRRWLTERVQEDFGVSLKAFLVLYTFDDTAHYENIYREDYLK